MNQKLQVFTFNFWKDWSVLTDLLKEVDCEVNESIDEKEVVQLIAVERSCILFLSLNGKDDLVKYANLVKELKRVARGTLYKIVVVNFTKQRTFDAIIGKIGIRDIVDEGINPRALKLKLDHWIKNIEVKAQPQKKSSSSTTLENSDIGSKDKLNGPQWENPLSIEDDIWLIHSEANCIKILGRWLVKILASGPFVSHWISSGQNQWEFVINDDYREILLPDGGKWIFQGDTKPEFDWKENLWHLTGSSFRLFYRKGKIEHDRIKLDKEKLVINRDSNFAREKQSVFIESFDKAIHVKKDTELLGPLQGNGRPENISQSPLRGKVTSTQDSFDDMSGEVNQETELLKNLEGKITNSRQESGHLKGKVKASGEVFSDYEGLVDLEPDLSKDHEGITEKARSEVGSLKGKVRPSGEVFSDYEGLVDLEPELLQDLEGKTKKPPSEAGLLKGQPTVPDLETGKLKGKVNEHALREKRDREAGPEPDPIEPLDSRVLEFASGLPPRTLRCEISASTIKLDCLFDDYFDGRIYLLVSSLEIENGSKIVFTLHFDYSGVKKNLRIEGILSDVQQIEENIFCLTLVLDERNKSLMNKFQLLYGQLQKQLENWLSITRGA